MKFQVGDEVTFMHWGMLGRLSGVVSTIYSNFHIVVTVDSAFTKGNFRMSHNDMCLKILFDYPLMKELS